MGSGFVPRRPGMTTGFGCLDLHHDAARRSDRHIGCAYGSYLIERYFWIAPQDAGSLCPRPVPLSRNIQIWLLSDEDTL